MECFQDHVGVSNAAPVDSPLHALPIHANSAPEELEDKSDDTPMTHIHDYIGGLRFRISPTAFFQVCALLWWKTQVPCVSKLLVSF